MDRWLAGGVDRQTGTEMRLRDGVGGRIRVWVYKRFCFACDAYIAVYVCMLRQTIIV